MMLFSASVLGAKCKFTEQEREGDINLIQILSTVQRSVSGKGTRCNLKVRKALLMDLTCIELDDTE